MPKKPPTGPLSRGETPIRDQYSPRQIAEILGVRVETIRSWIASGKIMVPPMSQGSDHRRMLHGDLLRYCLANKLIEPAKVIGWTPSVLIWTKKQHEVALLREVLGKVPPLVYVDTENECLLALERNHPVTAVVDFAPKPKVAEALLMSLKVLLPWMRLIGLADPDEDATQPDPRPQCDEVYEWPWDLEALAVSLRIGHT